MKQYCRYCAYCFDAGEFRCSNHPNGKHVYMTRADINRANKCPNYQYSDLGDVETGKQYHPVKGKRKDKRKEKHIMQESLFERKEE